MLLRGRAGIALFQRVKPRAKVLLSAEYLKPHQRDSDSWVVSRLITLLTLMDVVGVVAAAAVSRVSRLAVGMRTTILALLVAFVFATTARVGLEEVDVVDGAVAVTARRIGGVAGADGATACSVFLSSGNEPSMAVAECVSTRHARTRYSEVRSALTTHEDATRFHWLAKHEAIPVGSGHVFRRSINSTSCCVLP
jgi:hypothetical protein